MSEDHKRNLRTMVRGVYDIQQLRIQIGNRIAMNYRAKLGQEPSTSEKELEKEAKRTLDLLRERYKLITDGMVSFPTPKKFKGDEVISTYAELCLVSRYIELRQAEEQMFRQLETVLLDFPIWTQFLEDVKGVGAAMAGVIISEFDIHKAKYPSSFWKYAGLDVGPDGVGRSRRKEHQVKRTYVDKKGKESERDSITFNPFLKTKMVGVLAGSFLKSGVAPKDKETKEVIGEVTGYRRIYETYKRRLETDPNRVKVTVEEYKKLSKISKTEAALVWTPGRINNASKRYMIKMFLMDLHMAWRELEGLPVSTPYSEGKLGIVHEG
ncbi:hypothetical protein LCGC14_0232680 [marine sediment metagenome]|uniref:Transposase IS116/IS110/IS902 C-terminal domain-containing protein n=1 Tax=marine sediment metagenome TaxID=412755 RepID=A0A0F9URK4_9ZZZZ